MNESERVPTVVADVVVGAVQNGQSDEWNDGNDERMKVHSVVEVPLEQSDAGTCESAAGAGVPGDDCEWAERNTENEGEGKRDGDESDVGDTSPRSGVCPRSGEVWRGRNHPSELGSQT